MSIEGALNRQDFARVLEKAYELEEARVTGSGYSLGDMEHAATAIGLQRGSIGHALDGIEEARQRRIGDWLGARTRLRTTIQSDVRLTADGMRRLTELLEEVGGVTLRSDQDELLTETEEGVRIRVRARRKGTQITAASDHASDIVGAATGMVSLSAVGAIVLVKALALGSAPEVLGVGAAALVASYLSLRIYLQSAQAGWRRRLDDICAAADRRVTRARSARGMTAVDERGGLT